MDVVRKIMHFDMDAFYAAIEQRDNPSLRGKPVVVGGSAQRGVVATASYEARVFGIHSAMPSAQAARLCPHALFVKPRFNVYRSVSETIMSIAREYTDLVEPLSLDEAYMDVSTNRKGIQYATRVAEDLRQRIRDETGLTASVGVAPNKFLAKVASDLNKPDGLSVIVPENVDLVLQKLPVRRIPGIGAVTEGKLKRLGIRTVGELRGLSERQLISQFGKTGAWFYQLARGNDRRAVIAHRERKSLSVERTFSEDIEDDKSARQKLWALSEELDARLSKRELRGKSITLKVTYSDFEKITRSLTTTHSIEGQSALYEFAEGLLEKTDCGNRPIRLLGLGISHFIDSDDEDAHDEESPFGTQLPLFPDLDL